MASFFNTLWNGEIPVMENRRPVLAGMLALLLGGAMAASLLLTTHNDALFLGPGLGMESDIQPFLSFRDYLQQIHPLLGVGLLAMAAFTAVFMTLLTVLSYFRYKQTFGVNYPLREHFTFPAVALMERVFFAVATVAMGVFAYSAGYDFEAGYKLIVHWALSTDQWVRATVPTLVELPYVVAFFISYGLAGFVHYWLHRLSHERRILWLLFHRFHHLPTVMYPASTPPVFFSVPLFVFVVIPYHLAFAMLTKIFCQEPLYFALIIYKLFFYLPDMWAHNTAMYQSGYKNPLVRFGSLFFSNGIYHYLHHTSEVINGKRANSINLGGSFFYLPDKLFGTFRPLSKEAPAVGLTGAPTLHYNPFRLAMSGMAQLAYELWHNRSLKQWFYIIAGSTDYCPPHSKDYALRENALRESAA